MKRLLFASVAALACLAFVAAAHGIDITAPLVTAASAIDPSSLLLLAAAPAAAGVITDTADEAAAQAQAAAEAEAAASAKAAERPDAAKAAKMVKARVLFAGAFGQVDDVATVTPKAAKAGVAAGELDPDKAAVAYAESLAAAVARS